MAQFKKSTLTNFYNIVLTLLISFILLPLSLPVFLPIYTFRYIISHLSSYTIKQHGSILSPLSSLLAAVDDLSHPNASIIVTIILEGKVNLCKVKEKVTKILPQYPQLTQTLTTWMGFFFWKVNPQFSLDNHLLINGSELVDKLKLEQIRESLVKKAFNPNQPLWDATFIQNYSDSHELFPKAGSDSYSVILLRFHHALADGYSVYHLTTQLCDSKPVQVKANYPHRNILTGFVFMLKQVLFSVPLTIYYLIKSGDKNVLKIDSRDFKGVETVAYCHDEVRVDEIKNVAKENSVSFLAVVLTMFSGGMRKYLSRFYGEDLIPNGIHIMCPIPLPNRPDGLTNYMILLPIPIPIKEPDAFKRTRKIQETLRKYKNSVIPNGFLLFAYSFGSLPTCLLNLMAKNVFGTSIVTSFPGPVNQMEFCGQKVLHVSNIGGIPKGTIATGFSCQTYNGIANFTFVAGQALIQDKERVETVLKFILEEIEALKIDTSIV